MQHFFQNLTNHQTALLILVFAAVCYAVYRTIKEVKASDHEPEIEQDED